MGSWTINLYGESGNHGTPSLLNLSKEDERILDQLFARRPANCQDYIESNLGLREHE